MGAGGKDHWDMWLGEAAGRGRWEGQVGETLEFTYKTVMIAGSLGTAHKNLCPTIQQGFPLVLPAHSPSLMAAVFTSASFQDTMTYGYVQ